MSKYPEQLDDDSSLPAVNDNITEIGEESINSLRDAVFNIEQALGIGIAGSSSSLAVRLGILINPDGTPNASAITSLGLITLPITNNQIADNAGIPESKLLLDYKTLDLYNYIQDLSRGINTSLGWINVSGIKLEPHLIGAIYRHDLSDIDVASSSTQFLNNKFRVARDNSNAYSVINDLNNEFLTHQWNDGSTFGTINQVITNNGSTYPSNYSHLASAIYLNTSRFDNIPQTNNNIQLFADYLDSQSLFVLGTRIQNLYSNGVSRISRSSNLTVDGYGQFIIPNTPAIAYLNNLGNNGSPYDDINSGDDIIEFKPSLADETSNSFDEKFALVRIGDIVRVNYGTIEVAFIIKEKKYIQSGGSKKYIVRIAGKNLSYSPNASARIDRPLFNNNKSAELSISPVNNQFNGQPSLVINNPRGAQALGIGFSPDEFDEAHYLLYLAIYPTGSPLDGYTILPAIDVTGNRGTTPGNYTLQSVVLATNNALHTSGFNYRFAAYSYQGEFGICLADAYNNASFSILNCVIKADGTIDINGTNLTFPNNVVDVQPTVGDEAPDPLGFGTFGANLASPPYMTSYGSAEASQLPTKIFIPLRRNNFYVNGAEQERLNLDIGQVLDGYGDGYWVGTINSQSITPGGMSVGRVENVYRVLLDLSASNLKVGKTLVVQSLGVGSLVDFGRFVISNISFGCSPTDFTDITVYDAVHGKGFSPTTTAAVGTPVALYFSSDSVSFNKESATDFTAVSPFKRHFEVYVDDTGNTFTHERGRINIGSSTLVVDGAINLYTFTELTKIDIVKISPTLRGYQFGSVNKITLNVSSYDSATGLFTGNLAKYDGTSFTHNGIVSIGKKGSPIRFYDETGIDFIDINIDLTTSMASFTNQIIDFQLFPSLALDAEIMLLATCQLNNISNTINQVIDQRQFGNISEKDLSTSALDYISLGDRLLHFNGIIRGFDISNITDGTITINGGVALVNGEIQQINSQIVIVPKITESFDASIFPINFGLCVNDDGDLVLIGLADYDSILSTPSGFPNRIIAVNNVVSNTFYSIETNNFSNILNNRRDLTLLYIISSTVSGTGTSATIVLSSRDVRRYAANSDGAIIPIVSSQGQGNFNNLSSALNWITFNSTYQDKLFIKGNSTINTNITYNESLIIEGNGNLAEINFTGTVNFTNMTINNLNVIFETTSALTNCTFNNCAISIDDISQLTNCVFTDCLFNINCTQGLTIVAGNKFIKCDFNYSGAAGGSYSSSDLVNASSGMIYASIGSGQEINNIVMTDCLFNTELTDRYSFISFQLTDPTAILSNVNISNNQFINTQTGVNDLRAVIAITSTITTAPGSIYPTNPKLSNVTINNNYCNQDQMIVISVKRTAAIVGGLLAANNVSISNNTCGVIGFMTGADLVANFTNQTTGLVRDKEDKLIIFGNSCKLIANLDYLGKYVPFYSGSAWVQVGTGAFAISNNMANWIAVGASGFTSPASGGNIVGNKLSPANSTFLTSYTDAFSSAVIPNVGVQLNAENSTHGSTQTIISNNSIIQNPLGNDDGSTNTYYYTNAIGLFNNALVTGNIINGVVNNISNPIILISNIPDILVSNNQISRNGLDTAGYVNITNALLTCTSTGEIVNNIFDSLFIDAANTIENVGTVYSNWTFDNNKNQVKYLPISLASNSLYATDNMTSVSGTFISTSSFGTIEVDTTHTGLSPETVVYNITLNGHIPVGVKIASVKIGVNASPATAVVASTGNSLILQANINNMNLVGNYITGTNSILDPKNYPSTTAVDAVYNFNSGNGSNWANLNSATVYLTVDFNSFIIDTSLSKNIINISFSFSTNFSSIPAGTEAFFISPIVIRCIL